MPIPVQVLLYEKIENNKIILFVIIKVTLEIKLEEAILILNVYHSKILFWALSGKNQHNIAPLLAACLSAKIFLILSYQCT